MAKNKKKQPKQGHPGRSQQAIVSVGQVKIDRGIDAMTPEFVRWYSQFDVDTETSLVVLAAVRETLYGYADNAPLDSVTAFDVRPLFAAIEELIEFQSGFEPAEQADQMRGLIHMAWADYLDYLEEMGLWEKSTQDLQWLRSKLEVSNLFATEDLEVSVAKGELEDLLLTDMTKPALVDLARSFAQWCANATGSVQGRILDEDFIPHAPKALNDGVLKTLNTEQAEQVLTFTFMGLLRAEVVALEAPNQLSAGARFSEFQKSAGELAFATMYMFLQSFLDAYLEMPEDTDPVVVETWGLANLWILEGIEAGGHEVAEPRDEQFSATVWDAAHQRMAVLRTLGLVEEGEYYSLPGFVAAFLTDIDEETEDENLTEQNLDSKWEELLAMLPDEPQRVKREEPYTGKVLQLKLGLQATKPPIWRRVLVPMDLHLGDLHDIIQASFDWYDGHLHEFRSGGYKGTSYGPEIEDMEYDEVEDGFLVSELLKAEKDRLDYAYDFGDGWEVRIDVEKVLDSAEGQLPRCTGGRRMAPLEDSGGPWGWAEMLKAMKDPAHEEHGEVSEWFEEMGVDEIDPAAFSIEEINEALELEF
ncbi:plasmid pRiA4b ORF-3 family protein [Arthrobacter sp. MYb213]|uniref:plasmid pRiA4b ORF-3 family protein n=1 Tax=Arthrobacter sp. MYb213 TaxID=1848595 RepID=UPI000CFACE01|nr:plasmid pRiA4b ORF-3 family protein [Arthrobacter sp. MYb213]PRB70209.1 hypothetical protein CQ011_08575 [Arthrobacter sp. MYb213]